jgi:hypothetical protein
MRHEKHDRGDKLRQIGGLLKGLYAFKGVPYAAPPVGELRWLPPSSQDVAGCEAGEDIRSDRSAGHAAAGLPVEPSAE